MSAVLEPQNHITYYNSHNRSYLGSWLMKEYSVLEGTYKDHQAELLSERPGQGSNLQLWVY